jgi:hypothetical protein
MSGRQDHRDRAPDAELRRWAIEQVSAGAGLDTLKDAAAICRLADCPRMVEDKMHAPCGVRFPGLAG